MSRHPVGRVDRSAELVPLPATRSTDGSRGAATERPTVGCPATERAPVPATRRGRQSVKVVEGLSGGIEPGSAVSVADLGLPVNGTNGVLLVFWKST